MHNSLILSNLQKGDVDSFEQLVKHYENKLFRFIYNMTRSTHATEDLIQEVFIKVYKNLYRYNPKYPIEPWLFKIAYNTTLNYIKANRWRSILVNMDQEIDREAYTDDRMEDIDLLQSILTEINSFKPDCRAILVLRIIEDLSFEQIADIIKISPDAAKVKFYRSRKILIQKLNTSMKEGL